MQSPPQGDLASASLPGEPRLGVCWHGELSRRFSAAWVPPAGLSLGAGAQRRHGAAPAFRTHACTAASWDDSQHRPSGKPPVSSTAGDPAVPDVSPTEQLPNAARAAAELPQLWVWLGRGRMARAGQGVCRLCAAWLRGDSHAWPSVAGWCIYRFVVGRPIVPRVETQLWQRYQLQSHRAPVVRKRRKGKVTTFCYPHPYPILS